MSDDQADFYGGILWDFQHVKHELKKADIILVLGGHDLRVPFYAAQLFHDGYASRIAVSGGIAHVGDMLATGWDVTEAEKFAEVLISNGVPIDKITLEKTAMNTGENFSKSLPLLGEFKSVLVVTKPYMERRAFATGAKHWPDKEIILTSPSISFKDYVAADIPRDLIINLMMGDFQRIDVYGKNGFQIPQEITPEAWEAFEKLKQLGFTKHLLK